MPSPDVGAKVMSFRGCLVAATLAGLLIMSAQSAPADEVADFYTGKTVTLVVGADAGGGYDIYARLLAQFLLKYIPGKPAMIVQNRPGAGSINATNYVYNVAPQDGTVVLSTNRTAAFAQVLGHPGPRYQATKFNWLGSLNNEVGVIEVRGDHPAKTVEDARKIPVIVGSASTGGDGDIYPTLMNNTLDTKFNIVRGYKGSVTVDLAIERREVDGQSDSFSAMVKHFPNWRQSMSVLVQLSMTKHPQMSDIPLIFDYIKPEFIKPGMTVEEVNTLWRIILIQKTMGRPFAVGPNVPPARVKALREAFTAAVRDPEFLAEAERTSNEINPVDGSEIQAALEKISSAPKSVIAKLNEAIGYKGETTP
jgi:tripartite-type tricarboxylate transporter receptor subunit TctC